VAAVREMRGVTEVGPVLQQVVRDAPRLTGLSAGLLALADRDTGELRAASAQSSFDVWSPGRLKEMSPSLAGDVVARQALESGQAIVVQEREEMPEWARKEGAGVLLALPLQAASRAIGVLYLWTSDAREIPEDGLERGRLYGVLAAAALASALTGQETQRQSQGLMSGLQEAIGRMERLREQRTDVTVGTLVVHGVRRQAVLDGEALNLSPTEFDVLYVLAQNAEQPVNEETILRRVWGEAFTGQANVVDVCIHRLRRKMPRDALVPRIVTVRGRGYMLTVPRERRASPAGSGEAVR
jgi:DNA-binding winged helix-turn-helix (wHTH) protein